MSFEWNEATLAQLHAIWPLDITTAEMGERIGTTKNAIISKARREGLPRKQDPRAPKHVYDRAQIVALRNQGCSPKEIATKLGLTLGTVRGIYYSRSQGLGKPKTERPPPKLRPRKEASVVLKLIPVKPVPIVGARGCCWPTWRTKDVAYWAAIRRGEVLECGAARASALDSYCATHKRASAGRAAA